MIKCGRRFDVCHCYLYCHDSAGLLAFKKFIGIYGVVFIARESRLRSKRSKHSAFELKVFKASCYNRKLKLKLKFIIKRFE